MTQPGPARQDPTQPGHDTDGPYLREMKSDELKISTQFVVSCFE